MSTRSFDSLLESIKASARPISSLEDDSVRELLVIADLVWGFDSEQDQLPLFYGIELLDDISKGRSAEFGHQMLLCFEIDSQAGDAQRLAAAVRELKGSSCYAGE